MEDYDPPRPQDPLNQLVKEDLDRLSVHELEARIETLKGETERTQARLGGAKDFRAGADALFKA